MPVVPVTRIPSHTTTELNNYLANATAWMNMVDSRQLPLRTLTHLGDEWDSGIPPDSCRAFYNSELVPFLNGRYSITLQADSHYGNNCTEYLRSHTDFAAVVNGNSWPSFIASVGPVGSSLRTAGYIVHKGSGCNPWDGSLLQAGRQHPFVAFGSICGHAGIFRETDFDPSLGEMFMVGAADKPGCVAWIGAQSGGEETLHLEWWRLWLWAWQQTTTVDDTYWLTLRTFAALHPGQIEYASGMQYFGLPLPWPSYDQPCSIEEQRSTGILSIAPHPMVGEAHISFDLPSLPPGTKVKVLAFDVAGRLVRQLEATEKGLVWDGKTDEGTPAPAGVYFVKLFVNKVRIATGKIVVMR